ncbi:polysaccharide deacetylase family protein [Azoarcus sp. DD4]|uniref:XrtA system polysaccharide deacetylase n=1 Tax=Azoarcus sp. DD4 TaxID=2027405 RepID=UPI001129BA4A|nr:XrtA system polysaccharide deacetylase [Azoarcus sp. DD4]QDF98676.1 polysaccharide deacetylase family protein [Azoarcus sp. DD4]
MQPDITNALTIDVEDYFQVSALAPHFPRQSWDTVPCRVERNVELILALLEQRGARATFFTLGWVAERFPHLVRRICDSGHELASHGYGHERASAQTPESFLADIALAKAVLEDICGHAVSGYRAPSFSIGESNPWAHDVIAEAGYAYSSSVYPVKHDHYGIPDAPRFPYRLANGLMEIPVTTMRWLGRNWPAGGGGYFRLLPYAVSRWQIAKVNHDDRRPAIFYFHPWEVDPEQPRVAGASAKTRFRHYVNLAHTESRLRRLLGDFRWGRADEVFRDAA